MEPPAFVAGLAALRRRGRADLALLAWIDRVSAIDLWVSVITVMELDLGAGLIARRDPAQGALLRRWIDGQVIRSFSERILPVDPPVARRCAELHVSDPRAERDALIGATALVHRLVLVTRNVKDFDGIPGIEVINPWGCPRI